MNTEPSFQTFAGDVSSESLQVALRPMDLVTGSPCFADLALFRDNRLQHAVRNPSGYYCLFDLPLGVSTIRVEPRGQDRSRFVPTSISVTLPHPVAQAPVMDLELAPTSAYPFSASATPVQGRVVAANGNPMSNVQVHVLPRPVQKTTTGSDGRFALDVKPAGATEDTFLVFTSDGPDISVPVQVQKGRITNVGDVLLA